MVSSRSIKSTQLFVHDYPHALNNKLNFLKANNFLAISYLECKVNSSTKEDCDSLKNNFLGGDHVSLNVSSLYTNVQLTEAINVCADLMVTILNYL